MIVFFTLVLSRASLLSSFRLSRSFSFSLLKEQSAPLLQAYYVNQAPDYISRFSYVPLEILSSKLHMLNVMCSHVCDVFPVFQVH